MIDCGFAIITLAALLAASSTAAIAKDSDDFVCKGQHIFPDPTEIRDTAHALAVMRRHPELKSLPGYLDESIEADYLEDSRMPDGGRALVIVVVVDTAYPKKEAEEIAKAKAAAPRQVEDVGVRIIGGGGAYLLGPIIYSEIEEPIDDARIRGVVRILTMLNPDVEWISVHIDETYLVRLQPTLKSIAVENCVLWNSRTIPNGRHRISLKAYFKDNREIPLGGNAIEVNVAN